MSSTDEPFASAWSGTVPDLLDALGVEWVVAGALPTALEAAGLQHRDDIAVIVGGDTTLDEAYVERWAREWDVADRWLSVRDRGG